MFPVRLRNQFMALYFDVSHSKFSCQHGICYRILQYIIDYLFVVCFVIIKIK